MLDQALGSVPIRMSAQDSVLAGFCNVCQAGGIAKGLIGNGSSLPCVVAGIGGKHLIVAYELQKAIAAAFHQESRTAGHGLKTAEIDLGKGGLIEHNLGSGKERHKGPAMDHKGRQSAKRLEKRASLRIVFVTDIAHKGHWHVPLKALARGRDKACLTEERKPKGPKTFLGEERNKVLLCHEGGIKAMGIGDVPGIAVGVDGIPDAWYGKVFRIKQEREIALITVEKHIRLKAQALYFGQKSCDIKGMVCGEGELLIRTHSKDVLPKALQGLDEERGSNIQNAHG